MTAGGRGLEPLFVAYSIKPIKIHSMLTVHVINVRDIKMLLRFLRDRWAHFCSDPAWKRFGNTTGPSGGFGAFCGAFLSTQNAVVRGCF